MLDLYAIVKAPDIEVSPMGFVDFVWNGPRGQRIVLSMTRKQARRLLERLAVVRDEAHPEPHPGKPGVARTP
jgi:hypothetical protein